MAVNGSHAVWRPYLTPKRDVLHIVRRCQQQCDRNCSVHSKRGNSVYSSSPLGRHGDVLMDTKRHRLGIDRRQLQRQLDPSCVVIVDDNCDRTTRMVRTHNDNDRALHSVETERYRNVRFRDIAVGSRNH